MRLLIFCIFFAITIAILGLIIGGYKNGRAFYEEKYNEGTLLGRNKADVVKLLGKPVFDSENSDAWVYQEGRDPDAFVDFKHGKVSKVTLLQRDHGNELVMVSILAIVAVSISSVLFYRNNKDLTVKGVAEARHEPSDYTQC